MLPWVSAVPSRNHRGPSPPSFQLPQPVPKRPIGGERPGWTRRFCYAFVRRLSGLAGKKRVCTVDDIPQSRIPKQPGFSPPLNLRTKYDGDIVLRFNVSTADEAKALAEAASVLFLDIWGSNNDWVDIRLAKDVVPPLLGLLPSSLQRSHTPLIYDLTQAVSRSYQSSSPSDQSPQVTRGSHVFTHDLHTSTDTTENPFFSNYQPMSVIIPWMKLLAALFPTHVRIFSIGQTFEGRDIPAFRLGVRPAEDRQEPRQPRKTVLISGGSHAREWISVSTVNYIANSLITSYGKSDLITKLLDKFDWVIIPTLNVDGYVYTWENDRLWRKNRQDTTLRFCHGIDLDRSFGFQWDGSSRGNPCSESFSGEYAFQAVESRRLAEWAKNEKDNNNIDFVGFLDFHSYSQQILYPYSYSCGNLPPSLENLEELAMGLAKAIRISTGEPYSITSACEGTITMESGQRLVHPRMETGGGSALDWFYQELGVRYAYQIKLRDTGSYGFLLPEENILPTGEEALHAIEYFGKFLESGMPFPVNELSTEDQPEEASTDQVPAKMGPVEVNANGVKDLGNTEEDANWELRRRRRR
ncbi:MAG: putative metallocarboxypeptidase ecm14 [Geoglossum simile]|nr:MAG: putative metallocarboxypeptidase ecm14 [Geoglossum simile]